MLKELLLISVFGSVLPYQFGDGLYNRESRPRINLDAEYWIEELGLVPSAVGGFITENFRIDEVLDNLPERYNGGNRSLGSAVTCLLRADQVSFLRTLQSDELWNFYYGRPISIYIIDPETGDLQVANLGPREENHFDFHVPRGTIYAARLKDPERGGYTLFGATLFPGFADSDIVVYTRQELVDRFPQHTELIDELIAP